MAEGSTPLPGLTLRIPRRRFLQFGGVQLASGGLTHLLAARSQAAVKSPSAGTKGRAKSCIMLFQVGGPYQCDSYDPKPDTAEEIRGPYKAISTRISGLRLTEALPLTAQHADKLAIIRTVHHQIRCHNPAIYCSVVGREATDALAVSSQTNAKRTDHPHYASVVARLQAKAPAMPAHVIIPNVTTNGPAKSPGLMAGYLGAAYDPFVVAADPSAAGFRVEAVALPQEIDAQRIGCRQTLLQQLDQVQRRIEQSGAVENMDVFHQRAFSLLTAPQAKQAFDLSQEPAQLRNRYGRHTQGQSTLLARRLVEAGVPFVSVFSHTAVEKDSWDTHDKHNERCRQLFPPADQTFSALLEDLAARDLLHECLVVWLGEFGRTPRMGYRFSNAGNTPDGRDHWCNCYSVALAGGGVQGGQVIGASDISGAYPKERPVHISDLAASLFHALGVDPRTQLYDIQGQLRVICDGNPVMELF